jgi:hypothetical protein
MVTAPVFTGYADILYMTINSGYCDIFFCPIFPILAQWNHSCILQNRLGFLLGMKIFEHPFTTKSSLFLYFDSIRHVSVISFTSRHMSIHAPTQHAV